LKELSEEERDVFGKIGVTREIDTAKNPYGKLRCTFCAQWHSMIESVNERQESFLGAELLSFLLWFLGFSQVALFFLQQAGPRKKNSV
jgi:hypothetical protein